MCLNEIECGRAVDIAILLDGSTSVGWAKFSTFKRLASTFVQLLDIERGVANVAIVTLAREAHVNVYLSKFVFIVLFSVT